MTEFLKTFFVREVFDEDVNGFFTVYNIFVGK